MFEFPASIGRLKKDNTLDFHLHPALGGGIIRLRNLDDPAKYQSAEFAAVAVDELTKNPKEMFDFLRFRLRWPGVKRPKFAGASNPGGPGHGWVKGLWVDRRFPPEMEAIADQFAFVQAKASDNPHLPPGYYERNLLTLPPDMAKKFAEGDWNTYTGQFFPRFNQEPHQHVISAEEARQRIKPWHRRWISGDWGHNHPHAIHWHTQDEHGAVLTYDELWDRLVDETQLGKRIGAREARYSHLRPLEGFAFSWDAGKLSPRAAQKLPKSIMQLVGDALPASVPKPYPADSSPGTRVSGWRLMGQLLDSDMWTISQACPRLIESIPLLIQDEDNPEDVLKVDWEANATIGDDPADSARMGLQHMVQMATVPVTEMATRRVAQYAQSRGKDIEELDINTRMQLQRRAIIQEQQRRNRRRGGLGKIWRPQTGI